MFPEVFQIHCAIRWKSYFEIDRGSTNRLVLLLSGLEHLALAAQAGHGLEVELRRREGADA